MTKKKWKHISISIETTQAEPLTIIKNSKTPDTTLWQESELKKYILVSSRNENVSKKNALQKLTLADKKQEKSYSKPISSYNLTAPYNRNLFYFHDLFSTTQKNLPLFSGTMRTVDLVEVAALFCTSFRVTHGENSEES